MCGYQYCIVTHLWPNHPFIDLNTIECGALWLSLYPSQSISPSVLNHHHLSPQQVHSNALRPSPHRMELQTTVAKRKAIRAVWDTFLKSGWWVASDPSLFLTISFNLTYNYATTVSTRINWSSKPKHVYLYLNVIYLKCHVCVSIIWYLHRLLFSS